MKFQKIQNIAIQIYLLISKELNSKKINSKISWKITKIFKNPKKLARHYQI
jgi:hypothetical protein